MQRDFPAICAWLASAFTALASLLLGDMDSILIMLFIFSFLDYLLGTMVACQGEGIKAWNRQRAIAGFTTKLAMIAVVIAVNLAGRQLQDNGAFRSLAILGFVYIEGTSILRNAKLLGVVAPAGVEETLAQLKPAWRQPPQPPDKPAAKDGKGQE